MMDNYHRKSKVLMTTLQRAIEIAVDAHKNQTQKNGLPYVLHPLSLMLSMKSDNERIAAVLHDVVEDTQWTLDDLAANGFKPEVLDAIDCLTHQDGVSYSDYIDRIKPNAIARNVKLADLEDNMDLLRIPEPTDKDLNRLKKYRLAWQTLNS